MIVSRFASGGYQADAYTAAGPDQTIVKRSDREQHRHRRSALVGAEVVDNKYRATCIDCFDCAQA
jgi:hypothetical protein